jgi:hypothetical protein
MKRSRPEEMGRLLLDFRVDTAVVRCARRLRRAIHSQLFREKTVKKGRLEESRIVDIGNDVKCLVCMLFVQEEI